MRVLFVYRCREMGYSINNVFKPIEDKMKEKCQCESITFEKPNYKPLTLIENIIKVRKYMKNNPDTIIHITGAENYLIPFICKYKTVVTVHDLGFYIRQKKNLYTYLKFILWIKPLLLANKVTFISEKSFLEAQKLVKFKKNQTCVITNPVSNLFKELSNRNFNSHKPRILHIGTKPNKNLERIIESIKDINCHLRIIGKLNDKDKNILKKHNTEFSQVQDISNDEIIKEYENCDIVCFASTYEGFGMPIIEGQAVGKAVVTSNISPMKEIANDSCVLVDPFNVASIKNGIIEAINNHSKYEELGKINVKRFSLDRKVEEYYNLYQKL